MPDTQAAAYDPRMDVVEKDEHQAGSLPWQIAQLERQTGSLADLVELLETRLRPILRDSDDLADPEALAPVPLSTHAGNVSGILARTNGTLRHLRSIIDRVDA